MDILLQLNNIIDEYNDIASQNSNSIQTLFKPWPRVKKRKEPVVQQEIKQVKVISTIEQNEIELADQVLQKAQRLLERQSLNSCGRETSDCPEGLIPFTNNKTHSTVNNSTATLPTGNKGTNVGMQNAKRMTSAAVKKAEVRKSTIHKEISSAKSTASSHTIDIHKKKTEMKFVPAHVKAPFNTKPAERRKPSAVGSKQSVQSLNKRERPNSTKRLNRSVTTTKNIDNKLSKNEFSSSVTAGAVTTKNNASVSIEKTTERTINRLSENMADVKVTDPQLNPAQVTAEHVVVDDPRFELLKDGHSIPISKKLRHLIMMNKKLRQQVKESSLLVKITESGLPSQMFMEKYNNYITLGSYKKHIGKMLLHSINKLTQLCQEMKTLSENEELSSGDMLRLRSIFGFVIESYTSIQQQYQHLYVQKDYPCGYKPDVNTLVWLPQKYHSVNINIPLKIQYSSIKQLKRYTHLLHHVQYLQYQLYQMDVSEDLLRDVQNEISYKESEFPGIYRSLYSLLCTNGQTIPSIIQDEDG